MSSYTENLNLFKYNTSSDGNLTFSINNALNDNWDKIDEAYGKSRRNIGEIVQSTIPLTDAGLHLLDGSLIQGTGIYTEFVQYIANIYNSSSSYFCTEANWQTSVTNYGVCGKFVYDSTNNTVRLPKITGFVEGASGVSVLGDLTEAGLPNITGTISKIIGMSGMTSSGAFSDDGNTVTSNTGSGSTIRNLREIYFNAQSSNSIYGNSTTVQPQSIKVLYYIVLANTTKTDIEVDIDEIATDLNSKADRDLSNLTSTSSTNFDGQWVSSTKTLSTATAVGTYTIDLSDYLPNDNYNYEIFVTGHISRTDSSSAVATLQSDIFTQSIHIGQVNSDVHHSTFAFSIPVERYLYFTVSNKALKTNDTYVIGYRRIGTND